MIKEPIQKEIGLDNKPNNNNVKHGGLQGWVCPKCGRVYSPFTSMCSYCVPSHMYNTITCSSTGDI